MPEPDVFDVHLHISFDADAGPGGSSVDDVLRKMDSNGIATAVASPWPGYETPNGVHSTRAQNEALHDVLLRWPDRFPVGLGVSEPRHGARAVDEARWALRGLGLAGLVFDNDFNGLSIDSAAMLPILEELAGTPDAVAAVYTGAYSVLRSPFRLGIVARRFPALRFLSLNSFADITYETASYDLAERLENIWFCLGNAKTQLFTVERAVERIGSQRVLFGSGIPLIERSHHLQMVMVADITEGARADVLAGSARRLFGLEGNR